MRLKINSFTLPEVIVVLIIIGAGIALFYGLLFLNWLSYEIELTRIELHQQSEEIFRQLSRDLLPSSSFSLGTGLTQSGNLTIFYPAFLGRSQVIYQINNNQLVRTEGGVNYILSENLDSANSFFQIDSGSLFFQLALFQDVIGGRRVIFSNTQQLLMRN
ncbi:MAG: hypothetical protein DRP61_02445 [Candidatus Omnitrophota bacterium]|nr:MAG: hypothetical protein DRP61_02445 [Candidatus Omnitrophota bacterium]RKY35700.1 MAG: hypothetical protein DRP69_00355 [Candidatus Omnitrophota bacterium]RKY43440.1 MAG: hypothetical protein DRP80_05215 [Candidatus Omnitrophota bacterium]